jgi:hypothetical protein
MSRRRQRSVLTGWGKSGNPRVFRGRTRNDEKERNQNKEKSQGKKKTGFHEDP